MDDLYKNKDQLLDEVAKLRQRVAHLEVLSNDRQHMQDSLTRLLELSQVLVSTHDIDQLLKQAINSSVSIATTADRGSIQVLDQESKTMRTVAVSGDTELRTNVIPFQPGFGIAGHAMVSGETINVPDVTVDKRFVKGELPLRFRSLLVAPLIFQGKRLGSLSLSSKQINAFSPSNETLIKLIADQTAAALENARLFNELHQATVTPK